MQRKGQPATLIFFSGKRWQRSWVKTQHASLPNGLTPAVLQLPDEQ